MSSSCVLMRIILCRHFLLFISVFSELSDYAVMQPFFENNEVKFSGDFMNFVKDMSRIVYNRKAEKKINEVSKRPDLSQQRITTTARSIEDSRRDVNKLFTQKAALRDVLMMKLVSYYEDKYKLTNPMTTVNLKTNNFIIAGGNRRRYDPARVVERTTTPVTVTDGSVAEVVVI